MVPGNFLNIDVIQPYLDHFGLEDREQLLQEFNIGFRRVRPNYSKPVDEPWAEGRLFDDLQPLSFFGTSGGVTAYDEVIEHRPFYDAETVDEVEAYPWPTSIEDWDFSVVPGRIDSHEQKFATMIGYWNPVLCQLFDFFGMEKTLINLHTKTSLIEATVAHIEGFYLKFYKAYFEAAEGKADFFAMGDDFADQRSLLMSPEMWRKFLKPTYKKIFALAKDHGFYVWFHACGVITEVIPDLIDIGMDVWETVQAHLPCSEPEKLKSRFGKDITFFGGISTQDVVPFGTPEDVRRLVRERIKVLGKNGGYICGADHHIKSSFPVENVVALFD